MSHPANLPERDVTPEKALRSRRRALKVLGLAGLGLAAGAGLWWWLREGTPEEVLGGGRWWLNQGEQGDAVAAGRVHLPGVGLFPARQNPRFAQVDRPVTRELEAARYCNFYEFSGGKHVWRHIDAFQPLPWTLEVAGLVARPQTFDLDHLLRTFPLEERVYRHRCVEAWAMVVPWTGFPLAELVRRAEPLPAARYLRFVTFDRPEQAGRMGNRSMPWPYNEGLTLAEATNELAFVAVGMYGHPLLKQHGAPVRLVVPWKYGFKSAKSLVRIEFTDRQPATFWNTLAPDEYDFAANVDPAVPHPRWSQASERMLGTGERRPTVRYNGYGEWVARLYS
jgi:sulfoxide reductase catalytic subunit YedY